MVRIKLKLELILSLIILSCCWQKLYGQWWIGYSGYMRWLRVNSLHTYFSEQGAEMEVSGDNDRDIRFSWPGEYGLIQSTMRANGMWLGCKDYYSPELNKTLSYLVVNAGPKPGEYQKRPIFNAVDFKLVGRFDHPVVLVNGEIATKLSLYDVLDRIDQSIPADRMILVKNHTLMGVTITKKIFAFTQQNHSNYYIYDYVLKNTGIISEEGNVYEQTLNDFMFSLLYRYAFAGESVPLFGQGWGVSNSTWGRNTINDVVGTDLNASEFIDPSSLFYHMRAHFAYYGPHSDRPLPLEDDWGCPNQLDDGVMAAAKFGGAAVLHVDKNVHDQSDDPYQPRTTHYIDSDAPEMQRADSLYDESVMQLRYQAMTKGHAALTHAEEIEISGLPANEWGGVIGGYSSLLGFGPYTLEPGDSIHIVLAHGVAGISREKNREVGGNWLQYYNGTGTPELIMPDGSITTDYTEYKKAWVWTGEDSLFKTFHSALSNYQSGYDIPQPPPPPEMFEVQSGGDCVQLTWADNATNWPNFNGYVIYRSEGNVMSPETVYEKIFKCDQSNVVHAYNDTTVVAGLHYYYYIQTKDDGSTNHMEPGEPLYSSMFWTMTDQPATPLHLVFVYPGDIDNNGIVDEQDILPIGLYFMENAHVRDTITFSWAPHQNLSSNHPVVLAITYADANGDGTVDEKDVIGIGVNWGNIHTNNKVSYCINPENKTLINVHREAFERLYYSLSGESEAVRSMKHLLESILDLNVPRQFSLSQNCPNPFNPKTKIQFALPEDQNVTLKVYNLLGKEVKVLIDHQPYETGIHTISLNEEDLASGVYIYRIVTEKWNTYRKMLVVK